MPLIGSDGAASAQGFGMFGAKAAPVYIEDVFSTYLYTGNGSTQTITNGIDLSTKGGLVWIKNRAIDKHCLYDTARGALKVLSSNATNAEQVAISGRDLTGFTASGFSLGPNYTAAVNENTANHASWTFRKQAKFFDVVTYTGNGVARTIAHNLGSVPGCIIVKKTSGSSNWAVYHRSLTSAAYTVLLNTTDAQMSDSAVWNSTAPTSTVFSVGGSAGGTNDSGETYVAYLFAHDAGGFGATGTDNVISCDTFTTDASGKATITLGYEPQLVIYKRSVSTGGDWWMYDTMRGLTVSLGNEYLRANLSSAAGVDSAQNYISPTATGFTMGNTASVGNSTTFIYIAIRRGPMKTPTSGTSVFAPVAGSYAATTALTTNFPVDMGILRPNRGGSFDPFLYDRLRGLAGTSSGANTTFLRTSDKTEEFTATEYVYGFDSNTSFKIGANVASSSSVFWSFRRAPGVFDVIAYAGNSSTRTLSHNLGIAPELWIVRKRNATSFANRTDWRVGSTGMLNTQYMSLNLTDARTAGGAPYWNNTYPTSSVISLGSDDSVNGTGYNYIAYLFGTVAGVSKVGTYTGSGTTKQIDCGFTSGARFVLIKRTDSTGDWYVWDSARGIVAGNDPYLLLNSTAAEVTSTDYIDTYSAGFEISSTAPAAINANGGSFIFLAIA